MTNTAKYKKRPSFLATVVFMRYQDLKKNILRLLIVASENFMP